MKRPPEQQHLPADGMSPPPEPDDDAVKAAIHTWLDKKTEQKRAGEDAKTAHLAAIAALDAAKLEWHPFLDPTTGKKRRFWVKAERKAATTTVPKPKAERKRRKRGGAERDDTEDTTVETRRVPRTAEHDKSADPFGAVRKGMQS